MTKKQYIKGIESFGKSQEEFLNKDIVEKYPYFLMGRLLSAKHAKSEEKTILALMHPDRVRLSTILQAKGKTVKEKEITKKKVVAFEEKKEDAASVLQKRLNEIANSEKKEHEASELEEAEPIFEPQSSVSLDELVEKFNNHPPSITPLGDDFDEESLYIDRGKHSSLEQMSIISETLAEVYVSQKLFSKAIEIYQELLLKYPEKNGIFASLIEKLENNVKQD